MASGHAAIVTGADHGIGAAAARALARHGHAVLCTFLRVQDPPDPGTPRAYRDHRAQDATAVVTEITKGGRRALAVEADLSDPAAPACCSIPPRSTWAPSTSWSTTRPAGPAATWTRQFAVDAMGAALLNAEFARQARPHARGAGR